jgi:hypothetical protein
MKVAVILPALLLWALSMTPAAGQEENLSDWERDYYDLDLHFRARVTLNDGSVLELTDFHSGLGLQRHMILVGDGQMLNIALRSVKRIVRHGARPDFVELHFEEGVKMTVIWQDYQRRTLSGTLPDGERWEAKIGEVRLVEITQIEEEQKD